MTRFRINVARLALTAAISVANLALPLSGELCAQEKAAPEKDLNEKSSEVLIGLAGISSYTAIQYIGSMADAYTAGTYDRVMVAKRMGALSGGLKVNVRQIQALIQDATISDVEKVKMERVLSICKSLVSLGDSLKKYVLNKKPEDLKSFHDVRTKVWTSIHKFLGLPDNIVEVLSPGGASLGK